MGPTLPDGIIPVDTLMGGVDQVTCAYLVVAEEPALIETGPATSAAALRDGLRSAGFDPKDIRHVALTHIHLDHAGGTGDFLGAFPEATAWIHGDVASHLADPTRLVASAARIYGQEELERLFGIPSPVDHARIRALADGELLDLGNRQLRALHTPGHAGSHLAYQDLQSDAVFTGDAVGVHLPGPDVFRPAAPPPEFDLEASLASISRIAEHARGTLLFAHFGATDGVDATCDAAAEVLSRWCEAARGEVAEGRSVDDLADHLRALDPAAGVEPDDMERLELMASYRMGALGMERYWRKRA